MICLLPPSIPEISCSAQLQLWCGGGISGAAHCFTALIGWSAPLSLVTTNITQIALIEQKYRQDSVRQIWRILLTCRASKPGQRTYINIPTSTINSLPNPTTNLTDYITNPFIEFDYQQKMAEKEIIEKIRKIQQEKVSPGEKNDLINNLLQSHERYI